MNDESVTVIPEDFQMETNETDYACLKLQSVVIASRLAALWDREQGSHTVGLCWSVLLEGPIGDAASFLSVRIAEFRKLALQYTEKAKNDKGMEWLSALTNNMDKLLCLLAMYEVVASSEEESAREGNTDWPAALGILLDAIDRIQATLEEVWKAVEETIKNSTAGEQAKGAKGQIGRQINAL